MIITRYIGIDFGTSSSIINIKDYKGDDPLEPGLPPRAITFNNQGYAPSIVFVVDNDFSNDENFICGIEAENCQMNGQLYRNFKIDLLSDHQDVKNNAIKLLFVYFKWLRRNYENHKPFFGDCNIEKTFVSFPLKWPEELRNATLEAAKKAGFDNVAGVDEASAAIHGLLFFQLEDLQTSEIIRKSSVLNIMLLDMGAGTSDVIIGKYHTSKEKIELIASYPNSPEDISFGGREFDENLCDMLGEFLIDNDVSYGETDKNRMIPPCKAWKESTLSPLLKRNEEIKKMPSFMIMLTNHLGYERKPFPPITRSSFENRFEQALNDFAALINNAMDAAIVMDAGIRSKEDIDLVVLTGGHSQWYFIKEMLCGCKTGANGVDVSFPKIAADPIRLLQLERPSETVAFGLAYQAVELDLKDISQYNVWFACSIGDTELPVKLLIRRGDILPYRNNTFLYAEDIQIEQHVLTSIDCDFQLFVECYLYIGGNDLDNAAKYATKLRLTCLPGPKVSLRKKELGAIIQKREVFVLMDTISIALKFTMNEEQQVIVNGMIDAEKYEPGYFSMKNL